MGLPGAWSVKNTLLLIAIVVLAYLISLSFKAGLADVFASQATRQLVLWTKIKQMPTEAQWQFAFRNIERAYNLQPWHADYFEILGRVLEWRALMSEPQAHEQAIQARRQALLYFTKAIVRRPSWSYAWASLALTKQRLNELDGDFVHAVTQAIRFGAHDSKVQLMIANVGLAAWRKLDHHLQVQVMQMVANGMQRWPTEIVAVARHHLMLGLVCANIPRTDIMKKYCHNTSLKAD